MGFFQIKTNKKQNQMQIIQEQIDVRVQNTQWSVLNEWKKMNEWKKSQINAGHLKTSPDYHLQVHIHLIFTSFIFHQYIFLAITCLELPRIGKLIGGKGQISGALQNLIIIYVTTSHGIKVPTTRGMKDGKELTQPFPAHLSLTV